MQNSDLKAATVERGVNDAGLQAQLAMAQRLDQLFHRLMDEVDKLDSLTYDTLTTSGSRRPATHPLISAAISAAKVAQNALKGCGLNDEARPPKAEEADPLAKFFEEMRQDA